MLLVPQRARSVCPRRESVDYVDIGMQHYRVYDADQCRPVRSGRSDRPGVESHAARTLPAANEETMRMYAEHEALNEEYMALVPAVLSPPDASDSPAVILPLTDRDV